jgi:hypothetical protein
VNQRVVNLQPDADVESRGDGEWEKNLEAIKAKIKKSYESPRAKTRLLGCQQ